MEGKTGDEGRETGKRKRGHPFWTAKLPLSFWLYKPNLSPSFSLAYLPLPVPCFSNLCRRGRRMKFEVFKMRRVCSKTAHAVGFRTAIESKFYSVAFFSEGTATAVPKFFGRAGARPFKKIRRLKSALRFSSSTTD